MKQGTAKTTHEGKPTITSHPVSPSAASQIGLAQDGRKETLYPGRGVESPAPKSTTIHKSGSQRG